MSLNETSDEQRSSISEDYRSLSPLGELATSMYQEVSDDSFQRMEKICEILDDDNFKDRLPHFHDTDEEVKFILGIEQYVKDSSLCSTLNSDAAKEEEDLIHNITRAITESIAEKSASESLQVPKVINDTLEEVDLLLAMGNKFENKEKFTFSTPRCPKSTMGRKLVPKVQSECKLTSKMPNINYKRGAQFSSPFSEVPDLSKKSPLREKQQLKSNSMTSYYTSKNQRM